MIKIKELIAELSKFDPELMVIMSKDAEGNRYMELSGIGLMYFDRSNDDAYTESDLEDADFGVPDKEGFEKSICFWPL